MMSSMRRMAFFAPSCLPPWPVAAVAAWRRAACRSAPVAPAATGQRPVPAPATIGYALADWRRLRQSDGYAFSDYARFLPPIPAGPAKRRCAAAPSRRCAAARCPLAWSPSSAPTTDHAAGRARLAEAYLATGSPAEALAAARAPGCRAISASNDEGDPARRFGGAADRGRS